MKSGLSLLSISNKWFQRRENKTTAYTCQSSKHLEGTKGKGKQREHFRDFHKNVFLQIRKIVKSKPQGAFQFCLENWKHGSNRSFVHWCKFTQKPSNLPKNEKSVNFQFYKVEPIGTLMNKNFIPSVFLFYKPHLIS